MNNIKFYFVYANIHVKLKNLLHMLLQNLKNDLIFFSITCIFQKITSKSCYRLKIEDSILVKIP